jgi:hypothetical protein
VISPQNYTILGTNFCLNSHSINQIIRKEAQKSLKRWQFLFFIINDSKKERNRNIKWRTSGKKK